MKRDLWLVGFSVVCSLLAAGLLYLAISRPRGQPVQLQAPPTSAPIQVYVTGAVKRPGVYSVPVGSRVGDVLQKAGGALEDADLTRINLAALLGDGQQVFVPMLVQESQAQAGGTNSYAERSQTLPGLPGESAADQGVQTQAGLAPLMNINTASQAELESLPGIGTKKAEAIIAYRQANGPFLSIEAIQEVDGIGPGIFAEIKDFITVNPTP
jgi:competence protein ComEA